MPYVFSYGTLQQAPVQIATYGRALDGQADTLPGYMTTRVPIANATTRARTGLTHHTNVVPSEHPDSVVPGTVFELTDAELSATDGYERDDDYARTAVTLSSGKTAWVYRHAADASPAGATVAADVTRADIVAMNLILLPRLPVTGVWMAAFAAVAAWSARPVLPERPLLFAGVVTGMAVAGVVFMFSACLILMLLTISRKQGFLGRHRFTLRDDGFEEDTGGTRTFTEWSGVRKAIVTRRYLCVLISAYRAHVIPRRAFDSQDAYEQFAGRLERHTRSPG